mgnify:CR=1
MDSLINYSVQLDPPSLLLRQECSHHVCDCDVTEVIDPIRDSRRKAQQGTRAALEVTAESV